MKKQVMSFILGMAIVIASVMNVSALETNIEAESLQETMENTEAEAAQESIETNYEPEIIETESVLETESVFESETETASETEIEPETEQKMEDYLRENYSLDRGILGKEANAVMATSADAGSVFDKESYLIPLSIPSVLEFSEARRVLTLVNQIRAENNLAPLMWDSEMEKASCLRAVECSLSVEHMRPNGTSWSSVYSGMHGENIAAGYWSAEEVVNGWMNSPGHKANILDPDYKTMTVSLNYSPWGGNEGYYYYWSQNFSCYEGDGIYCDNSIEGLETDVIVEALGEEADRQVKNFVIRLYENVLGRMPDIGGLAGWIMALESESNTGAEAAHGFFFSEEFENKNLSNSEYLDVLYTTILNRNSDEVGKASWNKLLEGGLSRTYVFHGFCESAEFSDLCASYGIVRGNVELTESRDQNSGITLFVSRLYSKALGRNADAEGLNDWTRLILNGESSPEKVAFGILFSDEFKNKNLDNGEYVKVLYRVFMDREADPSGYEAWKEMLDAGWKREVIFYGFSKSREFSEILDSFGLSQSSGEPVHVTRTGSKFHKSGCSKINNVQTNILLIQDAQSIGYTPCQICN